MEIGNHPAKLFSPGDVSISCGVLQVKHSVFDFLGSALVPELGANVAAGAPGYVHLALVGVAAFRALPDELAVLFNYLNLSVPAADLAVVALGVQLGVDDVVIDELHYGENGF